MTKQIPPLLFLLVLIPVAFGCSSTESPTTSNSNIGTSTCSGLVLPYDFQNRPNNNSNSISIKLNGTTISTIADSTGRWSIDKIPLGKYQLVISKEGFYTYRDSITIAEEKTSYFFQTYLRIFAPYVPILDGIIMPITKLPSGRDTLIPGSIFAHTITNDKSLYAVSGELVFGRTPQLTISTFRRDYGSGIYFSFIQGTDSIFNLTEQLNSSIFTKKGFTRGDTIYFRLYPSVSIGYGFNLPQDAPIGESYDERGSNILSGILQ